MNKGIIMQINGKTAIVMTPDRQFLKVPYEPGMQIGQETVVRTAQAAVPSRPAYRTGSFIRTGIAAASILLMLGAWQGWVRHANAQTLAYVSLDINPSLEMAVNRGNNVMDARALSPDGQLLLREVPVKGVPVDKAIALLTQDAYRHGFLKSGGEVLITASPGDAQSNMGDLTKLEEKLVFAAANAIDNFNVSGVHVDGIKVSPKVRQAALADGVSPGKYALYLEARSHGIPVALSELKNESIKELIQTHGGSLAELIHQIQGGATLDELLNTTGSSGGGNTAGASGGNAIPLSALGGLNGKGATPSSLSSPTGTGTKPSPDSGTATAPSSAAPSPSAPNVSGAPVDASLSVSPPPAAPPQENMQHTPPPSGNPSQGFLSDIIGSL
jgi:hypothetical protein